MSDRRALTVPYRDGCPYVSSSGRSARPGRHALTEPWPVRCLLVLLLFSYLARPWRLWAGVALHFVHTWVSDEPLNDLQTTCSSFPARVRLLLPIPYPTLLKEMPACLHFFSFSCLSSQDFCLLSSLSLSLFGLFTVSIEATHTFKLPSFGHLTSSLVGICRWWEEEMCSSLKWGVWRPKL